MDKTIQEERIRGYFITAAKDLIRAEGLAVVTARNVAERAGYSYATLYNYFHDIRDLIFCCIEDFMDECREFVQNETLHAKTKTYVEKLLLLSKAFAKFFIQYPGIFVLLYEQKSNSIATQNSNIGEIGGFFDSLTSEIWQELGEKNKSTKHAMETRRMTHALALQGMLMMHINRRDNRDYPGLIRDIERITLFVAE